MNERKLKWEFTHGETKDGKQYLSLLGEVFNTTTSDGGINLIAEMVSNLDNAIVNYYKSEYYNNPANRNPFDQEMYSGATNMGTSQFVTPSMARKGTNIINFRYDKGEVRYEQSQNHNGWSFGWGRGDVVDKTGYFIHIGKGAIATVSQGRNEVVNWIFPTTGVWQETKNKVEKLLKNRQW